VRDIDQATRSLRLIGKGTDTTGSSGASMDLLARIDDAEDGLCALIGASDVSMSGKAAAFGARMMNTVADQIMGQFAENFAAEVAALQAQQSGTAAAGEGAAPPPRDRELNALKLAWAVIKAWFRGLFSRKKA
jgi:hypothetical protein